eukprot:1142451-Pelagomonas_calceolata.AAC.3
MAAFHPDIYKMKFIFNIKNWRVITYTYDLCMMVVTFNTKMTLHHLLAQVFTNQAKTLLNPLSSCDCAESPMDVDLQILSSG